MATIIGALGQGATFSDQDIVLSFDNFHTTRRYLRTAQFEKAIAHLNSSSDDNTSMTVFIHLENALHRLLDSILMNPHVLPYTARTNSALTKVVDQLMQQTVSHPVLPLVPSSSQVPSLPPVPSPSQVPSLPLVTSLSSSSSFHLHLHDLHHIHAPQSVAGEGVPCNITDVPFDDASIYKTCASIKASSCDVGMACVVYHLQDDDDPSNIVLMIDAEAALTVDDTKKNNDDLSNVVSMIDHAEAALTISDTKKTDNDHNNIVSTIDTDTVSTDNNKEPSDYNAVMETTMKKQSTVTMPYQHSMK